MKRTKATFLRRTLQYLNTPSPGLFLGRNAVFHRGFQRLLDTKAIKRFIRDRQIKEEEVIPDFSRPQQ
jgi:hypothetical protein